MASPSDPQPPALIHVTGIGSMPGTDADEATRVVVGELDVPHLVELPDRGPGGDMVGRTLGLIAATTGDFAAETTPTGWRLAGGRTGGEPGLQMRRARAWLGEDADRLEEHLQGFSGQTKAQVAGPWTLAAALEAVLGTRVLADRAACADLGAALAEAVAAHLTDLRRRVPGAELVLQLDEPSLPAVRSGRVRTASGRGALRTPDEPELAGVLAPVVSAAREAGAREVVVHCCAPDVPVGLLRRAGVGAVSLDLAAVGQRADEALGGWWEAGGLVLLGVAPPLDPEPTAARAMPESLTRAVDGLWRRIGYAAADVAERTWLTPGCGLAGASPGWARSVGGLLRSAARMLADAE
ncbi:MAG: hypothetical protein MUF35_04215 [Candidatus Nanopelagicales bacterium]|nr:hypothetical protein [Candidatus Nanopelagicales bacterium]